MPRTVGASLLAHMAGPSFSVCHLLKVGPLPDNTYLGFTSLDRDVTYDDGTGSLTYYASTGVELANLASASDGSVGNTEAQTLTPLEAYPNTGITTAMLVNGAISGVEFHVYKVNWADLTMGHMEVMAGEVGEVRQRTGGLITLELREWTDLLRQNSAISVTSLTCRAKRFGSQDGDEREWCGYDITSEWVDAVTVTSVGTDSTRDFTASSLAQAADYFAPGFLVWESGDNVLIESEVRSFASGGGVGLRFSLPNAIQIGDTFKIRRDCTRKWSGHNSCDTYANRLYFRGEPFSPTSNLIALTVPGAAAGGYQ